MLTVYTFQGCSTCRNAVKWLRAKEIAFDEKPIRETPPAPDELRAMLAARGALKPMLNTSGQDYRSLGLAEQLPTMSTDEVLGLLSQNGNLIRRPFAINPVRGVFLTGFREEEWQAALG